MLPLVPESLREEAGPEILSYLNGLLLYFIGAVGATYNTTTAGAFILNYKMEEHGI